MNQFYVKTSSDYITQSDFEKFDVWCEWASSDEIEYIKSQLKSPELFEELFLKHYVQGLDCYYPIHEGDSLPYREFMHVACKAKILENVELAGYVSLVCNEVTSLTLWINSSEVQLLRSDRLIADEDNPKNISFIVEHFGLELFDEIYYSTSYNDSKGDLIQGRLQLIAAN